jgi:hypothetical protein
MKTRLIFLLLLIMFNVIRVNAQCAGNNDIGAFQGQPDQLYTINVEGGDYFSFQVNQYDTVLLSFCN